MTFNFANHHDEYRVYQVGQNDSSLLEASYNNAFTNVFCLNYLSGFYKVFCPSCVCNMHQSIPLHLAVIACKTSEKNGLPLNGLIRTGGTITPMASKAQRSWAKAFADTVILPMARNRASASGNIGSYSARGDGLVRRPAAISAPNRRRKGYTVRTPSDMDATHILWSSPSMTFGQLIMSRSPFISRPFF